MYTGIEGTTILETKTVKGLDIDIYNDTLLHMHISKMAITHGQLTGWIPRSLKKSNLETTLNLWKILFFAAWTTVLKYGHYILAN